MDGEGGGRRVQGGKHMYTCGGFILMFGVSYKTCTQVKNQQLEPDMEQWTGSKLGKEYVKAIYCHPAYLTGCMYAYVNRKGKTRHLFKKN